MPALGEGAMVREGKLLDRERVANRVGINRVRRRITRARKKKREEPTRSSEGGSARCPSDGGEADV